MNALLKIMLVPAAVLSLLGVSCGRATAERVTVGGVESVSRLGWSGADVTLTVRNGLRRDIAVESCRAVFGTESGALAEAELKGGASVPRLTEQRVKMRFKISSDNPSAMQLLWRRFSDGELGGVRLDIEAVVRIGGRERKIYAAERNLSEILSNFGVSEAEFSACFQ